MSIQNGYTTLAKVRALLEIGASDTSKDAILEDGIAEASRLFDRLTGRRFYPRIETRYFDTPAGRELWLDDDLLAVTSIANGDGVAVTAAEYTLYPLNATPKYKIRLKTSTSTFWSTESDADSDGVIAVTGWWGHRPQYEQWGWKSATTVNESLGLNATDVTFTVSSGALTPDDRIVKIDSEILVISAVATNDLTVIRRGDNGSTAATHANGAAVSLWTVDEPVERAVQEMVISAFKRRFGTNLQGVPEGSTITPQGLVITPQGVPRSARDVIDGLRRTL